MIKQLFLLIVLLSSHSTLMATDLPDVNSVYEQLDKIVENLDEYLNQRLSRIDKTKESFVGTKELTKRYELGKELFAEYSQVMNDSALKYSKICIEIAKKLNRKDMEAECYIRMAHQYAKSGDYSDASRYFEKVHSEDMTAQSRLEYYSGLSHLYREMATYSNETQHKQEYHTLSNAYCDSLLNNADTASILWISRKVGRLLKQDEIQKAKYYSDVWLSKVKPDTPAYAYMAYFRSAVYGRMGDHEMEEYWLALSAIYDLKCAVMNQASLWNLAEKLSHKGELERAYNYVESAWRCASIFNVHLRSWQISPVLTIINNKYKSHLRNVNRISWILTGAVSLLALVMLGLYIYVKRKRKQLAIARNELKASNDELESLNEQLSANNEKLSESNNLLSETNLLLQNTNEQLHNSIIHLNDSNRIKDEYIGKFFSTCSEYIDKLDQYRIKIQRKLKVKQYNDLLHLVSSEQLKEDELKKLLENFDTIFLQLFPTFVHDFNSLLRPEERIYPSVKNSLNTELRIFALIRLGIDKSSKIAEFLHISPNSIYVYRTNTKNKATGNRDNFEHFVKEIGIINQPF